MEESIYSQLADGINSAVSRRKFLQLGAVGSGTILAGSALTRLQAMAAPPVGPNDGIVVFVYLMGGNDPLNTLAPYTDSKYTGLRPTISLSPDSTDPLRRCIDIDGQYGLHSALPNVKTLYDQGKVNFLQGVGFPGQGLSHFSSLDQYNQGWSGQQIQNTGWLGRYLDTFEDASTEHSRAITINGVRPPSLIGLNAIPLSLPTFIGNAYFGTPDAKKPDFQKYVECSAGSFNNWPKGPENTMAGKIAKTMQDVICLPSTYRASYENLTQSTTPTNIETSMAVTAGIINANLGARVFHLELSGFDTHTEQLKYQNYYLSQLDAAIGTFFNNLSAQSADQVTVVVYSEMGRRIQENGTGTDHGTASLMMVMGNKVRGGMGTPAPSLQSPDTNGNLAYTTDFLQVYSELLTDVYKTDADKILGTSTAKTGSKIGLFSGGPVA